MSTGTAVVQISPREIYDKHKVGDPISDEEIEFGLKFFGELVDHLECLGAEFRFATRELRELHYALVWMKEARKHR